jgi:ubiquinone/menaquinone biosynthesis C-methylase UbiE
MVKATAEKKVNAFGSRLYSIGEVLKEKNTEVIAVGMLSSVFVHLGVPNEKATRLALNTVEEAKALKQKDYEAKISSYLRDEKVIGLIPKKLEGRAALIRSQILGHLKRGEVLDLGCGDGRVGAIVSKRKEFHVSLADVYTNPAVFDTATDYNLSFSRFIQGEAVPFTDARFDTTLALTIFHHSDDPVKLIREVARVTKKGGRVVVIESVYGVDGRELGEADRARIGPYLTLDWEEQRRVNIFFDHFYNRIVHYSADPQKQVNVPFNFNTPQGWENLFRDEGKLTQERLIHLGIDQPAVPEYHTLHVLKKD